jgi:diketogulonate reductase-like aldo/keto reductase
MKGACDSFPTLCEIAKKHGKTPSQIALRILIEAGVMPIPKSVHSERIAENFALFDFTLDSDDKNKIYSMDEFRCGSHPLSLNRK